MEDKGVVAVVGIVCLTAYGIYMGSRGIDSAIMVSIAGLIGGIVAGIGGFVLGKRRS